jgi:soluble lytic murein transglycosylase-like protein
LPVNVVSDADHDPSWPKVRIWCDLIVRVAGEDSLDPFLIAAVIWQESRGDPIAMSPYPYGAVGLMQVMPRDGYAKDKMCEYGLCFADRPTIVELQDPETNVRHGCQMLADLISQKGSVREALFAYGPEDDGYVYADTVRWLYGILKNSL